MNQTFRRATECLYKLKNWDDILGDWLCSWTQPYFWMNLIRKEKYNHSMKLRTDFEIKQTTYIYMYTYIYIYIHTCIQYIRVYVCMYNLISLHSAILMRLKWLRIDGLCQALKKPSREISGSCFEGSASANCVQKMETSDINTCFCCWYNKYKN